MTVTSGTISTVDTLISSAVSPLQVARLTFTMSGIYAQDDNSILTGVAALIAASRRNGRTATMVDVMAGEPASKASDPAAIMGVKTVAISTNDVTFELTDGDYSTELADGAIPAQERPFSILVAFTEA